MIDQREYGEIKQMLGRIETDLQLLRAEQRDTRNYAREISVRVRSLEISRGRIVGWAAGAGGIVGTIVSMIVAYFTGGNG